MPLVMTVAMEDLKVAESIRSSQAFGEDVIDFPDISIVKGQSTIAAFPFLLGEKSRDFSAEQGMMLHESLTPIEKITIIWASCSSYFHMVRDSRLAV